MNAQKFALEINEMLEDGMELFVETMEAEKVEFNSVEFMDGLLLFCRERSRNIAQAYADRVLDEKHVDNTGNCACKVCS